MQSFRSLTMTLQLLPRVVEFVAIKIQRKVAKTLDRVLGLLEVAAFQDSGTTAPQTRRISCSDTIRYPAPNFDSERVSRSESARTSNRGALLLGTIRAGRA